MSLVEVLISSGILVVGLLSLAALIPVGMFQAAQAARADSASAVGRAAWRTVKVAKLLEPRRLDGQGSYWCPNPNDAGTVVQCVAPFPSLPTPDRSSNTATKINYAGAYVIDPFGLSNSNTGSAGPMGTFPARQNGVALTSGLWLPRVSLMARSPAGFGTTWLAGEPARRMFTSTNDPTYDMTGISGELNRPSRTMTANTAGVLNEDGAMKFEGHYSWFVTVSPVFREWNPLLAADDTAGLITGVPGGSIPTTFREFNVSVAVVYRRPVPLAGTASGIGFGTNEELRAVVLPSSDPFCREVTLQWTGSTDLEAVPKLRAKEWVLLYGTVRGGSGAVVGSAFQQATDSVNGTLTNFFPSSGTGLMLAKWCQIQATDAAEVVSGNVEQRLTLKASDFETVAGGSPALGLPLPADSVFAATLPGVVGVYEKTMRLE